MSTEIARITKKGLVLDVDSPTSAEEHMAEFLNSKIIGQSGAISAAVRIKTRALSPLRRNGCAGFYAFQGQPGVGKTELVKMIAQYIHGDPMAFVLIDGGLLKDDNQASSLNGAPPMYVGYEDPEKAQKRMAAEKATLDKLREQNPALAAKYKTFNPRKLLTRQNLVASRGTSKVPLTIVFIDEVDKMHKSLDDMFLNAVVNGIMPMSDNELVDVSDVIFIIAGNHGSQDVVERKRHIGFRTADDNEAERQVEDEEKILAAMKIRHRPEFLDRIDEIIFFNKLTNDDLKIITGIRMSEVVDRYLEVMPRGTAFTLTFDDSARDFIFGESMKESGNARRIGRMVQLHFTDKLDRLIAKMRDNDVQITPDDLVKVSHAAGASKLTFELFEDEGDPSLGDKIEVRGDTKVSQLFLGRDRKRKTLSLKTRPSDKKVYAVRIKCDSEMEMLEHWMMYKKEVKEILELNLVAVEVAAGEPWILSLFVECSALQSKELEDNFLQDGCTVELTDRKAVSAK